jgi:hypothetical protein
MLAETGDGVMTQIHFNLPPELAEIGNESGLNGTGRLCLLCILYAKGDQLDRTEATWAPLVGDGKDTTHKYIGWPDGLKAAIREAVVVGVSEIPGLPLIPCCWDHLATARRPAVEKPAPPHLPGYAGLPAGLNGKRGRG